MVVAVFVYWTVMTFLFP